MCEGDKEVHLSCAFVNLNCSFRKIIRFYFDILLNIWQLISLVILHLQICDMLDPFPFEETYIEGTDYTGQQQQNHFENIVEPIFCSSSNNNTTDPAKMRGESPDTACKVPDSTDFYQGYPAQSYPTDYSESHERLTQPGNYDVPYCAKLMDSSPVCEDRNASYDRQYPPNKRAKMSGMQKFCVLLLLFTFLILSSSYL